MSEIESLSYHPPVSRDGNWTHSERDPTGSIYEELVKAIFEEILAQDSVRTIEIKRHAILQGITIQHEVDVFWRFEAGGLEYSTIVQAKDWSSPVKQGDLLQFKSVLGDLPGQVRGVYVTRTGYQKGAKKFAKAQGIKLFELTRIPGERPEKITMSCHGWAEIKIVSLELTKDSSSTKAGNRFEATNLLGTKAIIHNPTFKPTIYVDPLWLSRQKKKLDVKKIKIPSLPPTEFYFYDEEGNTLYSLNDLYRELLNGPSRKDSGTRSKDFTEPVFIITNTSGLPRVKLARLLVAVTYDTHERLLGFMTSTDLIDLMLRDLDNGKIRFFRIPKKRVAVG